MRDYVLGILTLLLLCGCQSDVVESVYPARPIRLVVPFSAGGGTDTFARIFKKAIEDNALTPQPVVIVNLAGAGATIGSRRVKNAVPDGYTILILHEAIVTARYANTASYGPEAFDPIACTGEIGMVLAVDESSPFQDLTDLLEKATRDPDSVLFAANLGAPSHFAGLMLEQKSPGSQFRYVQYGGGADRFAAIRGGQVQLSAFSLAEYVRFQPAGLRALAFLGTERHPEIPEIPTAREQGYDLVSQNVMFWWAPRGTPRDRIDYLADLLDRAMQTRYVQDKLAELKYEPTFLVDVPLIERIQSLDEEVGRVVPRKPVGIPDLASWLLGLVTILAICVALQTWRARKTEGWDSIPPSGGDRRPVVRAWVMAVSVLVYVGLLNLGTPGFVWSTGGFVLLAGGLLSESRRQWIRRVIPLAVVLSFGLHGILTRVFELELP